MIAAPMVVLAVQYLDMRCVRCGRYRLDHVRGMSPLGKRSCPTFTGRRR